MGDSLRNAITALFSGNSVAEANTFIISFSTTAECWKAAYALVADADALLPVRYFALNILYQKVRKDLSQLTDFERAALFDGVMNVLASITVSDDSMVLVRRLVATSASLCLQLSSGLSQYFSNCVQAMQLTHDRSSAVKGLLMVAALAEEFETADLSRALLLDVERAMLNMQPQLFEVLQTMVRNGVAYSNKDTYLLMMRLIAAWVRSTKLGISLVKLRSDYNELFEAVANGFRSNDIEILAVVSDLSASLLRVVSYPRNSSHYDAVLVLLQCLLDARGSILHIIRNLDADDASTFVADFCGFLCTVATTEADLLVCSGMRPFISEFFEFLLDCVSCPPRSRMMLTFDFWFDMQDIETASRHPEIGSVVFPELLQRLLRLCRYPALFEASLWGDGDDDLTGASQGLDTDYEDFVALRDTRTGIDELFVTCLLNTGPTFFQILSGHAQPAFADRMCWAELEVVLFVLNCAMVSIKSDYLRMNSQPARSVDGHIFRQMDEPRSAALILLGRLLHHIFNYNFSHSSGKSPTSKRLLALQTSACRFVGALTFLLSSREVVQLHTNVAANGESICFSDFYWRACAFVLQSALADQTVCAYISSEKSRLRTTAAKALHQLCVHGVPILQTLDPNYGFDGLLRAFEEGVRRSVDSIRFEQTSVELSLVESLTRATYNTDRSMQGHYLECLTTPSLQRIASNSSVFATNNSLLLLGQIVRFSDSRSDGEEDATITSALLNVLWPAVQSVDQHALAVITTNSHDCSVSLDEIVHTKNLTLSLQGKVLTCLSGRNHLKAVAISIRPLVIQNVRDTLQLAFARVGDTKAMSQLLFSGLDCAKVVVENTGSVTPSSEEQEDLAMLLVACVDAVMCFGGFETATPLQHDQMDNASQLFTLVHAFLVFSPRTVVLGNNAGGDLSQQQRLLAMAMACLQCSFASKDLVRNVLQVTQFLFNPPEQLKEVDVQRQTSSYSLHSIALNESAPFGAQYVQLLLSAVSDGRFTSSLMSNLIDSLHGAIIGSFDASYRESFKTWLVTAVLPKSRDDGSAPLFERVGVDEQRLQCVQRLYELAVSGDRKFRAMLQDIFKICQGEQTSDCLLAYF